MADDYFKPRNILKGFKGTTYLESGYIFAPYIPLLISPQLLVQEKPKEKYIPKDSGFRTKHIHVWMYSDVKKKTIRNLSDPLPLP